MMVFVTNLCLLFLFATVEWIVAILFISLLLGALWYISKLQKKVQHEKEIISKLEVQKISLANKIGERIREVEKQTEELEALDQIVRIINKDLALPQVLRNLLLQGIQLLAKAESGAFLIFDPVISRFKIGAVFGYDFEDVKDVTFSLEEARLRYSLPTERVKEGVFIVPKFDDSRAGSDKVAKLSTPKSMLAMTVIIEGNLEGFIIFDSFSSSNAFDEADVLKMARFRDHAVPAFSKAHFLNLIEVRNEELATLERIVRIVNQEVEFERVLQSLLEQGLELISKAESGTFFNFESDIERFKIVATVGYSKSETSHIELKWEEAVARYTDANDLVREGVYVIKAPHERAAYQQFRTLKTPVVMLTLPIRLEEKLVGFIIFESFSDERAFSQHEIQRLMRFRDHAVSAYSKARFLDAIQKQKRDLEDANKLIQRKSMDVIMAYEIIEIKNKDITDSIQYAKRIQEAIMPKISDFAKLFEHSFILYLPKDIVSGDFYWFAQKNDLYIWAAVDCTGHGVPGAFMSVMGSTLLNSIVMEQSITDPALILNTLNKEVKLMLKQNDDQIKSYDGMELGLFAYNPQTHEITFSGANRPMYFLRDGELEEIKGDKIPIGAGPFQSTTLFTNTVIKTKKGDCFYVCSDGYGDQFGGANDRKFTSKKLKDLLLQIQAYALSDQLKILNKVIEDWRGKTPQTDDVLVMGIQIS
jgi:serine phosphatase RsbU (regulator of sigma subunit)